MNKLSGNNELHMEI